MKKIINWLKKHGEKMLRPLATGVGAVTGAGIVAFGLMGLILTRDNSEGIFYYVLLGGGLLFCSILIISVEREARRKNYKAAEERRENLWAELEQKGKSITRSIQVNNMEGTADYFEISKSHVRFSFGFSIFACIVGLIFLGVAVFRTMTDQSFASALIPTIGGAVAEFIAATVFWVHRKSAEQLNRYYDSLHEIEVFLSTTDMIFELSTPEKKDEAILMTLSELYEVQKIKAAKPAKHDNPKDKEG